MSNSRRFLIFFSISITLISSKGFAQQLAASEILENVKKQFEKVQDYTAQLTAKVDMERLKIPEMKVKIFFKQPDKIHIESNNFAMLPREGIALNPSRLIDKFTAEISQKEVQGSATFYTLKLTSKPEKGKMTIESYVTVDGSRWVITHLESSPDNVRRIVVDFEYTTVQNTYTVFSKISASFGTIIPDSTEERPSTPRRMPRKGSVIISYSDYEVNTGLSDEFFEKKNEKK